MSRPLGRPKIPKELRKSKTVHFRLSTSELAATKAAALAQGKSLTEYLREKALAS